uniref:ATPase subunit 8 n=1 Tax=Mystilus priamus TaxID=2813419 RepID=A0A8T9ZZQ5_9HEMI|nr:ATPase subunit 8 [Mystilus priamus]
MPQMAPVWWTPMFVMFISIYIMFMIIIYFKKTPKEILNQQKNIKNNKTNNNWMW